LICASLIVCFRHYIAKARTFRPVVTDAVSRYVVDTYVQLRKKGRIQEEENKTHTYTSARTLLAILRLAQALARIRWADEVILSDVDEALRLMEASRESLVDDSMRDVDADQTETSKIFRIIRNMTTSSRSGGRRLGKGPSGENDMEVDEEGDEELLISDIRARVLSQSFTETQLMDTILEVRFPFNSHPLAQFVSVLVQYEDLDIWTRVANGSKLRFVNP
jgi:DNA replication licensing factor MCM7